MKKMIILMIKSLGRLLFNLEQKRLIASFINRLKGKENAHINLLKTNFLEHGFTEKAAVDLERVVKGRSKPYIKKLAAWELARWYANSRNEAGASKCLDYLPVILNNAGSIEEKRQAAVLQAECHQVLGDRDNAKRVIMEALASDAHPDLYLAAANLEKEAADRLYWINKALGNQGLGKIALNPSDTLSPYDWLAAGCDSSGRANSSKEALKVTVIIPAYNSASGLPTALNAILAQTWSNLEVLVVDDCSSDNTQEVIEKYRRKDDRVSLLSTPVNSGPYVARNTALKQASGDFITTNDADDWSHPQKIEIQAMHLLRNPEVMANMSEQARATAELKFYRRGTYGKIIFSNKSSLMFRRLPVMEALGHWDSVRFGGDTEFIRRLRIFFGREAVVQLKTGPLSFVRQASTSLTGNHYFGFNEYHMGARKEHLESHEYYLEKTRKYYYRFPLPVRPFPVPEPMWPCREEKTAGYRLFDVVLVSDFRFGKTAADFNIREIKAFKKKGLRIGLVQIYQYNCRPTKKVSYQVRELIDGDRVQMLVYGEKINCEKLLVLDPAALKEKQRYIPEIKPGEVRVLIERLPFRNKEGKTSYSGYLHKGDQLLKEYFGQHGVWHPFNSRVRKQLIEQDENLAEKINLSMKDWLTAY